MIKKPWSDSFWKHLHPYYLTAEMIRFTHTFCLGGLTFLLFFILNVTGLLLLFYYLPLADKAYLSVSNVTFVIPFGGFIRSLHYWAGQAMVVTLLLHMIRVFYYRAYRPPRSLNWLVGVGLLILTLFLDFTGYVLRWDADTYSATVVGTQIVRPDPLGRFGPLSSAGRRGPVWRNHGASLLRAPLFSPPGGFVRPDFLSFLAGQERRDGGTAPIKKGTFRPYGWAPPISDMASGSRRKGFPKVLRTSNPGLRYSLYLKQAHTPSLLTPPGTGPCLLKRRFPEPSPLATDLKMANRAISALSSFRPWPSPPVWAFPLFQSPVSRPSRVPLFP